MRLLDTYATNTGSRIDKPFIYTKFFPLPIGKFITIQTQTPYESRNYSYWQEVIKLIHEVLTENNIYIVQVGSKDEKPLNGVINLIGQTNINQLAYIIENSNLHFGPDSLCVHLASNFNKPIVSLYSISNPNVAGPHFGDKDKHILLKGYERVGNKKPSYSQIESPKSIDTIKPEEIAEAILKLLNINHKNFPESIFFGQDYNVKSFELILDGIIDPLSFSVENPIIRMDYSFNEEALEIILKSKKSIIFTNKPIKKDLIKKYKQNINQVIYIVEEDNDVNFVKFLKSQSINYVLFSFLDESILNKFKIDYMDYSLIINRKHKTKEDSKILNTDNLFYSSSRTLLSSKGQFISRYDWIHNTGNKVIDTDDFWKELDNFYIFKLTT
jgi:hypothetical protein